jgi:hypothetical protein
LRTRVFAGRDQAIIASGGIPSVPLQDGVQARLITVHHTLRIQTPFSVGTWFRRFFIAV